MTYKTKRFLKDPNLGHGELLLNDMFSILRSEEGCRQSRSCVHSNCRSLLLGALS
jgi:hypothetical protein